jgi:multidrug efflux pump subunit AcrA (membrane-fusion protein)
VGGNTAFVEINNKDGKPVQYLHLYLRTLLLGMQMPLSKGLLLWSAVQKSHGRYQIPFQLGMFGKWKFELLLDQGRTSKKIFSIEENVKTEGHFVRDLLLILLGVGMLSLFFFFFPKKVLSMRTGISFLLFLGLTAGGYAFTKTLRKSLWPGEEAYSNMGMKMKMNQSNMGLSTREFGSAVPVAAEQIEPASFSETVSYPGYVEPDLIETIYPRVTGWLLKMPFYPGMKVHAGEVIGKLDTSRLEPAVLEARERFEASQKAAQAADLSFLSMKNKVQAAEAALEYWKKEIEREKYLVKQGAVSLESYQGEKARYLEALNRFKSAERLARAAFLKRLEAEKMVKANQAVLKLDRAVLSYSILKTNISGIVTKRFVNRGVLVNPGMKILLIEKISRLRIQSHVSETDLNRIHVGTPVMIQAPDVPEKMIHAKVTSIFYTANLLTHTGVVEARIPNLLDSLFRGKESLHQKDLLYQEKENEQTPQWSLFPGEYVTMRFVLNHLSQVLSVPSAAIQTYHPFPKIPNHFLKYPRVRHYVWIVDKHDLVHRQFVQIGFSSGEKTEILKGLKPGEWVVYKGWQNLQEMQPVRIVNHRLHEHVMKMKGMSGMPGASETPETHSMKGSGNSMKGMKMP